MLMLLCSQGVTWRMQMLTITLFPQQHTGLQHDMLRNIARNKSAQGEWVHLSSRQAEGNIACKSACHVYVCEYNESGAHAIFKGNAPNPHTYLQSPPEHMCEAHLNICAKPT